MAVLYGQGRLFFIGANFFFRKEPSRKMPSDLLLEELFAYEPGWEKAILDGQAKGIKQSLLEQYSSPSFRGKLKDRKPGTGS